MQIWSKRTLVALAVVAGLSSNAIAAAPARRQPVRKAQSGRPNANARPYKLDKELTTRADRQANRRTRVIVELLPGAELPAQFAAYAKRNGRLGIINGQVLDLPDRLLRQMAAMPSVFRVHYDRPTSKFNYRTSLTIGTTAIRQTLGYTGAQVGVAVIDSGIAAWHDDLTIAPVAGTSSNQYGMSPSMTMGFPYGDQRVKMFVDFVNGLTAPYDDNGHGTHVAGIIAGNGFDSNGQKAGAAPQASLVSLKVLDANGTGTISNIIAALDWVLAHHGEYNIRVVNLSVGAGVYESAWTDPLTLAAKRVVDAGVVVVAAAGNLGKNAAGLPQYGGITAPGNAPWVLTVGASSTNGTPRRTDDVMGSYSSRGPTYLDWSAKPDLVAPGTGTVSLAAPGSTFYNTKPLQLLAGSIPTGAMPYLSLSGTSMAAPVVSGVVALMMQANPNLTPNAVKAILQYTAQEYPGYNGLTQGTGFLNAVGAVRLAKYYASGWGPVPVQAMWSKHIIWGNHRLGGGVLDLNANAFSLGRNWGAVRTDDGDNIIWGTECPDSSCDNVTWGTDDGDNIVWGTECSDANCDNVTWGTDDGDNIVWGTDCGGADCDNVTWGTSDEGDNIIWGTADDGDNIIWGTDDGDNIVWGTDDGDNIIWGTDDGDNIVWGTTLDEYNVLWATAGSLMPVYQTWSGWGYTYTWEVWAPQVFDLLKDRTLLQLLQYAPPPVPPPATNNGDSSGPPPPENNTQDGAPGDGDPVNNTVPPPTPPSGSTGGDFIGGGI